MKTAAGLFTVEVARVASHLPHPDLPLPIRRVVVEAIRAAWTRLRDSSGAALTSFPENQMTALLTRHLNQIRAEDKHPSGFRGDLFQDVVSGAELAAHDGSSLEKKPDITIRLVARMPLPPLSEYHGLFIECKIVDRNHAINLYGKNGLIRFVNGSYAWTMPSAMMIAYARDQKTVPGNLAPFLKNARRRGRDPYGTCSTPQLDGTLTHNHQAQVFVSTHAREWSYQGTHHGPGKISIYHLWLPAG